MNRGIVCLLWSVIAVAQVRQREPFDTAIQAYGAARNAGHFDEAAAKRAEARDLLDRTPVDAPQFGNWTQTVAQLYQQASMSVQARAIVEKALSRAAALGESHPTRILLLTTLAENWQQDRNLLKALVYWEKAAAAADHAPPPKSPLPDGSERIAYISGSGRFRSNNSLSVYQRLAHLDQRLG